MCQGGVDEGKLWNGHFDRVISKLNVHRSMRGIAVYTRIIDNELIILNVSTDGILVCTKSTTVRSKSASHPRKFFPLTTKEGPVIDYLNYRIIQSTNHISHDQTPRIKSFTDSYF